MKKYLTIVALAWSFIVMTAQENNDRLTISGSIQSDILIPQDDNKIGTEHTDDKALTNTYVEVNAMSKYVDAGVRMEYLEHPLPGFENDFKGWGVPHIYLKGKLKNIELTLGNFYEQFGSGLIFRSYEERSLGIDNSLFGGRIVYRPAKSITFKAITGKQRRYWDLNDSWISGGDIEMNVDQWIKTLANSNTFLTIGFSWVNKYEKQEDIMVDATHKLNLPKYVNAFDVRAHLQKSGFSFLAEYAHKTQDPSFDNGYSYSQGDAAMLSTSYSRRGFSVLLQAKRSENMSFRSRRSMNGSSSMLNHLPAFTMEHTYALAAIYPYATNPDGEWAYQASLSNLFKRGTSIGGKYGTKVKLNYSYVDWKGKMYYQDMNMQVNKKVTKRLTLDLMLMNQFYNKSIVEGEGGIIHSNIFVAEGKYRLSKALTLRGEAQYLHSDDDQGDWLYGVLELSAIPHWMLTISDMYNSGETDIHYYQGFVTFSTGAHRLQLGYGRTRAGYNCSGGVCRYVPASKGVTLSYNYNF